MKLQVYEIRMKLYMLKELPLKDTQSAITALLDQGFAKNEALLELHKATYPKGYCFDLPFKCESNYIYEEGKIYTLTIRTVRPELARYFTEIAVNEHTQEIKALTAEVRILPKKVITSLYTLTPVIIKNPGKGYWKTFMPEEEYEERIRVNLIKKWNYFTEQKIKEDFSLYTLFRFLNEGPIKTAYKNIALLGDKIELQISDNEMAQNLAYLALGTGLGEGGSRGFGFVNYKCF